MPGSTAGDSAGVNWTKEGPVVTAVTGSDLMCLGGESGTGETLHGTPP